MSSGRPATDGPVSRPSSCTRCCRRTEHLEPAGRAPLARPTTPSEPNMNATSAPADLVLVGGAVMTMDAARPSAAAVAVSNGRFVAIGDEADVGDLVGPRTRRIDLRGRTLLPGFIDLHCHPVMAGVDLMRCPLHELPP